MNIVTPGGLSATSGWMPHADWHDTRAWFIKWRGWVIDVVPMGRDGHHDELFARMDVLADLFGVA